MTATPKLVPSRGCAEGTVPLIYNHMVSDCVADPAPAEAGVDRLFGALADRTRRDILRRSLAGELSVSALARSYRMSLPAVQKHVAVLDRAGLVTKQRHGREQLVRTDLSTLRTARLLLDQLELEWRGRIDRFTDVLDRQPEEGALP